ncbi:MAG: hypothetical protein ACQKBU_09490 [Verrucomicrobiales bacterium]
MPLCTWGGGDDVSADRPYEEGSSSNDAIEANLRSIYATLEAAGIQVIPMRLSFRDYKTDPLVNGGANPENGSLPYNLNIVDALIEEVVPTAFDSLTGLPVVDTYNYFLENQDILASDGIHLGTGGRAAWSQDILAGMGAVLVYAGAPVPLRISKSPEDLAITAGGQAVFSVEY